MTPAYPALGFALIAQLDHDGSGGLSMSEITTDIGNAIPALATPADFEQLSEKIPLKEIGKLPALLGYLLQ